MKMHSTLARGFTIVELLIVIVVISILSSLVITSYSGINNRSIVTTQKSDLRQLRSAIMAARVNSDKTLLQIVNDDWVGGGCQYIQVSGIDYGYNPSHTLPSQLPKSHMCWVKYYDALDKIALSSNINLSGLRDGDPRGNPYYIDANEGEGGSCAHDELVGFGNNADELDWTGAYDYLPSYSQACQ